MQIGAITGYIDVAQVALYVFWAFFFGLIYYLRREDKREGYPLVTDFEGNGRVEGFPKAPPPKFFKMPGGGWNTAPRKQEMEPSFSYEPTELWPGAPIQPVGNPLLSGVGPSAYALRADKPEMMQESDEPRLLPLRVATDHFINEEGPNPMGYDVVGADGVMAGVVSDVWVDLSEVLIRYIEVKLPSGIAVLVPSPLVKVDDKNGRMVVRSVMGKDFANAPVLANPDVVTLREEDRISAYFAAGQLYAEPSRMGPLL